MPPSLRHLLQLDFSMDPMVGSSAIIMNGGPPRAAAGQGQKQGESLLPYGAAAAGTHAPGTDRASQAAVAAWERARGIGSSGQVAVTVPQTGSDLGGGVAIVPYPMAVGGRAPAGPAHQPGTPPLPPLSHTASPTVIALAASALGLVLVMGLTAAGVAARKLAVKRRAAGGGVIVGAATTPSVTAATADLSTTAAAASLWWRWPAVRMPSAPFSGDSALGTPASRAGPPANNNLSPGIARRLVSVDDSAYGEEEPPGSAENAATTTGPSFFARSGRPVDDSADPEA